MNLLNKKLKKEKITLLFKNLEKACLRLKEAARQPSTVFNQDSTIKRFEFTFEMTWKLMKALVESEGLEAASPKQAIRKAADIGIIDNPEKWFEFLGNRNLTVHTYKEEIAKKVYQAAKEFIPFVENFLQKVKSSLT